MSRARSECVDFYFFFNDTATTEIYTLSLHDALPILVGSADRAGGSAPRYWSTNHQPTSEEPTRPAGSVSAPSTPAAANRRSEEHTSELQSRQYLVWRLLLEKKKKHRRRSLRFSCCIS